MSAIEEDEEPPEQPEFLCYDWYPDNRKMDAVSKHKRLERQYQSLQASYFDLSASMSRLQFCVRQIIEAAPRDRNRMIDELKSKIFRNVDTISEVFDDSLPTLEQHNIEMGDLKRRQFSLMQMLRERVGSLEKASEGIPTEVVKREQNEECEPYPGNEPEEEPEEEEEYDEEEPEDEPEPKK